MFIFAYKFKCHKKITVEEAISFYEEQFTDREEGCTFYFFIFALPMFIIFYAFFQMLYFLFKDMRI